jgi:hypothetical protein
MEYLHGKKSGGEKSTLIVMIVAKQPGVITLNHQPE